MSSKALLAALIAAVVAFLLGWLVFGILLMDYYTTSIVQYTGLVKNPPDVLPIALANLTFGFLLAWIFSMAGIKTLAKGFSTGFIIVLLMILGFDLIMYSQFNLYGVKLIAIDVAVNAVMGGIVGAIIGWWLGRGPK